MVCDEPARASTQKLDSLAFFLGHEKIFRSGCFPATGVLLSGDEPPRKMPENLNFVQRRVAFYPIRSSPETIGSLCRSDSDGGHESGMK
jgi:hypothetical protein